MGGSKVAARCLPARARQHARSLAIRRAFASSASARSEPSATSAPSDSSPLPPVPAAPAATYADFISRRLNELHVSAPSGLTPQQLARAHYLLTPPPPSALSALANRIPGLPDRLTLDSALAAIEQCLVSPSFWEGIEKEDVPLGGLKRTVAKYAPLPPTEAQWKNRFLPGMITGSTAPDQSMDANPRMQPPNTARRKTFHAEQRVSSPRKAQAERARIAEEVVPRFTNFLDEGRLDNGQYAVLGNSVLGMLGAEWLDDRYPNLPTSAFQAALTMYVGPRTCADVSRLWGVSSGAGLPHLSHSKKPFLSSSSSFAGRQHEVRAEPDTSLGSGKAKVRKGQEVVLDQSVPGLLRWRRPGPDIEDQTGWDQATSYEDAMASVSRAFVGLVFAREGLGAARELVRRNWLNRRADVADVLKFGNPKFVLRSTLLQRGREPPVGRLLRETGRLSATPVFIIGSYSGTSKIGEGFGSSLKMAEYRAHEDALRRIYLAPSSPSSSLPSDTLVSPDSAFVPRPDFGTVEVLEGSGGRTGRKADESIEEAMKRREEKAVERVKGKKVAVAV